MVMVVFFAASFVLSSSGSSGSYGLGKLVVVVARKVGSGQHGFLGAAHTSTDCVQGLFLPLPLPNLHNHFLFWIFALNQLD